MPVSYNYNATQKVCKDCHVLFDIENFYIADKSTGRRETNCKQCRCARRLTDQRREYMRTRRAAKKAAHEYGTCTNCHNPLGRHEHGKERKRIMTICARCVKGENHHNWKGGKSHNADGYVTVRVGPHTVRLEHRVVIEEHLGRKLHKDETVHHRNGVRTDNRIENLEVWVGAPRRGIRIQDAVEWAREILERYDS